MAKTDPSEPATDAFVTGLPAKERRTRELVLELTPEERSALPARMRGLGVDEHTLAWNQAKADRDAALAAAEELEDPDERVAALAAAAEAWQARKAELLAEG